MMSLFPLRYCLSLIMSVLFVLAINYSEANAASGFYGCYEVTAPKSINIRQRAFSKAPIIGVARRGQVLGKWRFFCSLRGYWCPVQKGNIRGHATKQYLKKVACP